MKTHIDGLVQERRKSITNAPELRHICLSFSFTGLAPLGNVD